MYLFIVYGTDPLLRTTSIYYLDATFFSIIYEMYMYINLTQNDLCVQTRSISNDLKIFELGLCNA